MATERWDFKDKIPILSNETPVLISSEYIDPYGKHLNQGMSLLLLGRVRGGIAERENLPLGFVTEQRARYRLQVFEGEQLMVASDVYRYQGQLHYHQRLQRQGETAVEAVVVTGVEGDHENQFTVEHGKKPALIEVRNSIVVGPEYLDVEHPSSFADPSLILRIFEAERLRMFDEKGLPWERLKDEFRIMGFVREQVARYYSLVPLGEEVEVVSSLMTLGARLTFDQKIVKGEKTVIEDSVEAVLVNLNGRPTRLPPKILEALQKIC